MCVSINKAMVGVVVSLLRILQEKAKHEERPERPVGSLLTLESG